MSTFVASNISDGTTTVGTEYLVNGSAKSTLHYNHSTATVNSSFNISSVTDNGTGLLSANYTSGFLSGADKSALAMAILSGTSVAFVSGPDDLSASLTGLVVTNAGGTSVDSNRLCLSTDGDLA